MLSLLFSLCLSAFARESAVVLISDSIPEYQETAQAFADSYKGQVQIFHLEGNKAKGMKIAQDLASDPPPAIFAIGAKAAYISTQQLSYIPCVYAMVHDPVKYGIYGDKVTGIADQPSAEVTLAQIRVFLPKVKKIGVFITDSSAVEGPSDAAQTAEAMGYEIEFIRLNSNSELRKQMSLLHKRVDAIWLMPDPSFITPENFHTLIMMANRNRLPVLTNSDLLTQAGSLFSVTPDRFGVGQQAANLVYEIYADRKDYGGMTFVPEVPRVTFNEQSQRILGLELEPFATGFIDDWIE